MVKKLVSLLAILSLTVSTLPIISVGAADDISVEGPTVLPYSSSGKLIAYNRNLTKKLGADVVITKQAASTDTRKVKLILAEYDTNRAMISSRFSEETTIPNDDNPVTIAMDAQAKTTGMFYTKAFLWYEDNTAAAASTSPYFESAISETLETNSTLDAVATKNLVEIAGKGNVNSEGAAIDGERATMVVINGEYDDSTPFYNLDAVYFDEVDITNGEFRTSFLLGEEDYGTYTVLVNAPSFTSVAKKSFTYAPVVYHDAYAEPIDAVADAILPIDASLTNNTWEHLEFKEGTPQVSYNVDFGSGASTIGCVVRTAFAQNTKGSLYLMIDGEEVGEIPSFNNGIWGNTSNPSAYKARYFYLTKPELCVGKKTVTFTMKDIMFGALDAFQFFTSTDSLDIGDPMYYDAYSELPSNSGYSSTADGVTTKRYPLDFGNYSGNLALKIYREYPAGSVSSKIEVKSGTTTVATATPYYVSETNGNEAKTMYVFVTNTALLKDEVLLFIEETGTAATKQARRLNAGEKL